MRIRTCLMRLVALAAISFLAACHTAPQRSGAESGLNLLKSARLIVPSDCEAAGSYVVSFTVASTGDTAGVRVSDAPSCIADALVAWVASFKYEAPGRATRETLEWMMVTGRRGS